MNELEQQQQQRQGEKTIEDLRREQGNKKKISNYLTTKILNDNDNEDVIPKHRHPNKQ